MFIPRVENPIKVRLGERCACLVLSDGKEQDLRSTGGCRFKGKHFGIDIEREMPTNLPLETVYFTQNEIEAVNFDNKAKILYIWERNKCPIAWKFNNKGQLLQRATYADFWDPSLDFISGHEKEIRENCGEIPIGESEEEDIKNLMAEANRVNNKQIDIVKPMQQVIQRNNSDGGKA